MAARRSVAEPIVSCLTICALDAKQVAYLVDVSTAC